MISFYIDKNKLDMDTLYDMYKVSDAEVTFSDWVIAQSEEGSIDVKDSTLFTKEEFQHRNVVAREDKLREIVVRDYLSDLKVSGKKRREAKDAYKESEEYRNDLALAIRRDNALRRWREDDFVAKRYEDYMQRERRYFPAKIRDALREYEKSLLQNSLKHLNMNEIFDSHLESLVEHCQAKIDQTLSKSKIYVYVPHQEHMGRQVFTDYTKMPLSQNHMGCYLHEFQGHPENYIADLLEKDCFLDAYLFDRVVDQDERLAEIRESEEHRELLYETCTDQLEWLEQEVIKRIKKSPAYILSLLMENSRYKKIAKNYYQKKKSAMDKKFVLEEEYIRGLKEKAKREKNIRKSILQTIPDNYIDLYPLARQMKRHFTLHMGPTNSGKTYGAMQALRKNGGGIYLAPLRLLAYEQFEALNMDGYPCDLVTGEEKTSIPFSTFQASTIEMADYARKYSMAVIDEAQMIEDRDRGGSWTSAILGLCAEEIHVCAAPNALQILIRLIEECGDTYEVIEHKRQIPLLVDHEMFLFPDNVQKKDALIVFSKKNVHAVASELQRVGIKCSIIYGNLPYDVRQEEARKFMQGETDVVVATDAIGMGMNLPIRRIVFLETSKYDGVETRYLKPEEIQQIGGRAGRRGMYEEGFVNSLGYKNVIRRALKAQVPDIEKAVIQFPETLISIKGRLSEILERWNELTANKGYEKANIEEQIKLCRDLEEKTDDKQLIYRFIMIPFDSYDPVLKAIWMELFQDELDQRGGNYRRFMPELLRQNSAEYLSELEQDYRICDLLYYYMDKFHEEKEFEDIIHLKKMISEQIMEILKNQKLIARRCKRCGKVMPWNHSYGICESCFNEQWKWK